jgi:hypothetical protein
MSDQVVAKDRGGTFTPHPEGQYVAICVDVINMGERVRDWEGHKKIQPSVVLVFASGERKEDGKLATVSAEFNVSMDTRAGLRHFLEGWRGKSYTREEVKEGIPIHALTGVPCLLTVEQKTSMGGRVYAIPRTPALLPKAMKDAIPDVSEYTRATYWEDRKASYAAEVAREHGTRGDGNGSVVVGGDDDIDDEIPF